MRIFFTATVMGVTTLALLVSGQPVFAASTADLPKKYLDQEITWQQCGGDSAPPADLPGRERFECGSFTAPENWQDAKKDKEITIQVSRVKSLDPKGPSKGDLFTNPGGPGAPGLRLPQSFLYANRTKVLDNFEVIGIDPRGTGKSTTIPTVDKQYVSTEQTVKDLDLLRQLLKREKVSFWGVSAGTWMGAYYATYFPKQVDKFVLDSSVEFTVSWAEGNRKNPTQFEARFKDYFVPWVAARDGAYGLGATGEAVDKTLGDLNTKLGKDGLKLPGDKRFTQDDLSRWKIDKVYVKRQFPALAGMLQQASKAVNGDEDALGKLAEILKDPADPYINEAGQAIRCNDFTWDLAVAPCPTSKVKMPKPDGVGVPSILMVQTEGDPATTLKGAQAAHAAFANSRMITVTDEGDHGIYVNDNPCVDDYVENYLVDGTVPAKDETCKGVPLP